MAAVRILCLLLLVYGDTEAKKLSGDTHLSEYEYHLVKCCGNIISTPFDDKRTLLVSVPEACDDQHNTRNSAATSRSYCKVTELLFASIHSYHKYPLLATGLARDGTFTNILRSEKATDFIIILGKGDEDMVFREFKSKLARLSQLPFWNARGRFIIMSLNRNIPPVNCVPEEHKLIRKILGELWEKEAVNSIVLANNMDECTSRATVDIHTWFPFTEGNCRGPVDKTVIIDQCVVKGECQFVKNAKLFPDKMSNFHGCVVRASTYPHEPFILSKKKDNSNVTQYSEGVEINVLQTIARQLNFTVVYIPETNSTTHKILSLFDEVSRKESDVGFASAPYSYNASDKIDHTIGYVQETVKWFGPLPKLSPHWKRPVIIFTPLMWLLLLIVYLIVSLIFWSLANVNIFVNEHVTYQNAVVCFLHTFSVVMGVVVFFRPHTWILRLFFIVWVYYCLLISTAYQSSLISVLTHPQFEPPFDTVEKLLNSRMPYGYIPPIKRWYNESEDAASKIILEKGIECTTLDECLKRIVSTQDFAVCGLGLHTLYLSYQKTYSYSAGPKFVPFKDEVVSYLASMFFRSGSPLLESFNRIIYRLVETGMVQKFWENIKMVHIANKEQDLHEDGNKEADGDGDDAVVLTVAHLQGEFILLLLGLICGLIVFVIELLCFSVSKYQFYPLPNISVREFKARNSVIFKNLAIHKTLVRRFTKRNLTGKVKRSP
jgi:hypothetical protein